MIVLKVGAREQRVGTAGVDFVVEFKKIGVVLDWISAWESVSGRTEQVASPCSSLAKDIL